MQTMRWPALLLLAAAGCAEQADPPPAPKPLPLTAAALPKTPPPAPPPFDFAAYGDCRSDHDVHGRICASILRSRPKFVMVSGDLVDFGESAEDWKTFRAVTKELRSRTEYWAAPGNHDVSSDRAFEKEFGLEKPYADRRSGDIHVFLLDSNAYFAEAEQVKWLDEKAAAS
ncbi:MAG TPA: metallophosphoesterase, partial [Planctomycetota bacterium]|nr:metallophosphoesterase [Planctomycetota bacterium]